MTHTLQVVCEAFFTWCVIHMHSQLRCAQHTCWSVLTDSGIAHLIRCAKHTSVFTAWKFLSEPLTSHRSLVNLQLSGELTTKALEDLGIPDTLGSYQGFHKRLLKWLVHWGLAAEIEEEEKWFVSSVLRPRSNPSESAISKTPFKPFPLSICFLQESSDDFTFHYLPEGLFPHFIVQLVKIGYILPKNTVEEDPEEDAPLALVVETQCLLGTRERISQHSISTSLTRPAT